jgi:cbb3-type cytochrome oxidase subunit 3
MTNNEKDHINIDTRPCPTAGTLSNTAVDASFFDGAGGEISLAPASSENSYLKTVAANTVFVTSPSLSGFFPQKTNAPIPPLPTLAVSTPQSRLSVGTISVIVLLVLLAFSIPIILLSRCLYRSQRRKARNKADNLVLEDVLRNRALSNEARRLGLTRLLEVSSTKITDEDVTEKLVGSLGMKKVDMGRKDKRVREEGRVLKRLFRGGSETHKMGWEKELPRRPVEVVVDIHE